MIGFEDVRFEVPLGTKCFAVYLESKCRKSETTCRSNRAMRIRETRGVMNISLVRSEDGPQCECASVLLTV